MMGCANQEVYSVLWLVGINLMVQNHLHTFLRRGYEFRDAGQGLRVCSADDDQ